jgi:hypothetical protein
MNENQETTILQEGLVRITNRRTLIGTQSYPLSDIKSITVIRRGKSARPVWLVLVGALLLLWSIIDQTGYYRGFFNCGIFLSVIGLVLVAIATPSYVIQIRNSSGVNDILGSIDRSLIQRIVEAMNKGIASRAADSGGKGHTATRKVSLG